MEGDEGRKSGFVPRERFPVASAIGVHGLTVSLYGYSATC